MAKNISIVANGDKYSGNNNELTTKIKFNTIKTILTIIKK